MWLYFLENSNAVLAILFGLSALYVSVESWLTYRTRLRIISMWFMFLLAVLNLSYGLWDILGQPYLTQTFLVLWLPMSVLLILMGKEIRARRYAKFDARNSIDVSLQVGALRLDQELTVLWASQGIEQIITYRASELINQPLERIIHDESLFTMREFREELSHGNVPFSLQVRVETKDNSLVWIEMANGRELDQAGTLRSVITGIKNITVQKSMEQEAALLREAIHALPVGVTISRLDDNRTILYVNHTEAAMHRYRCYDLVGKSIRLLAPEPLRKLYNGHFSPEALDGLDRETLNVRKGGEIFPIRLRTVLLYDNKHKPFAIASLSEELSNTFFSHGILCEGEDIEAISVKNLSQFVMMIYFDSERNVLLANTAALTSFGYTLSELQEDIERVCATPEDLKKAQGYLFSPSRKLVTVNVRTKSGDIKAQRWVGFHAVHGTLIAGFDCRENGV